jgi:ammonium transporter Rh
VRIAQLRSGGKPASRALALQAREWHLAQVQMHNLGSVVGGKGSAAAAAAQESPRGRVLEASLMSDETQGGAGRDLWLVGGIAALEVAVLALYGVWGEYNSDKVAEDLGRYARFQDVHVMIFVGFGFLMTFPRRYGYSALTLNLLCAALAVQVYPLAATFWSHALLGQWGGAVQLNVTALIMGDFSAGAALIALGALLGKITAAQTLAVALSAVVFYALNEEVGLLLGASDIGGSMAIHAFGAVFGLACSRTSTPAQARKRPSENAPVYHSDLFSMVGTLFLWVYWPSFNSALGNDAAESRIIVNTLLSLTGSVFSTVALSRLLRGRIAMVDIQNATMAGGVAIGAACDMAINPAVALASGLLAGAVSTLGFARLQALVEKHCGLHDTCGVLHLHGWPAVLGALISAIAAAYTPGLKPGAQLAFLGATLATALLAGSATGLVIANALPRVDDDKFFSDLQTFEVPEEETPYFFATPPRTWSRDSDAAAAVV